MVRQEAVSECVVCGCCNEADVTAVVYQQTIWPDVTDVRVHTKDRKVYSAMYDGDKPLTEFAEVKQQEVK